MVDQDRLLNLIEIFVRMANKYNMINAQPLDYGTGDLIHPSEIHLLNAAEKKQDENITELSSYLGITKSAASQTVMKLEKKGYCRKVKLENRKNIYLEITPKGKNAVKCFREYKSRLFADLIKVFESSGDNKIKVLEEAFIHLDEHMDLLAKEYRTAH